MPQKSWWNFKAWIIQKCER